MKYIIKSGDTLSKIANAHEISLAELLEANPQYKAHPDRINVGDVLVFTDGGEEEPVINDTEDDASGDSPSPAAAPSDGHELGKLSAKFETGGRGPGTVSGGEGDPGGPSYGSYQMTSKGGGTVGLFVSQAGFSWKNDFAGLVPGKAPFTAAWKKNCRCRPQPFPRRPA